MKTEFVPLNQAEGHFIMFKWNDLNQEVVFFFSGIMYELPINRQRYQNCNVFEGTIKNE